MKKRMFSAIQPTGPLHIGNYFGALKAWVEHQHSYECFFCIVDYHSITTPFEPKKLKENKLEVAITYLAVGLDPSICKLFFQSDVPEHTELAWVLNSLAPFGMLERMTQFKDKTQQHGQESANAGLFCYPVLQAADILLYKTSLVPVGKDQAQHLELTRELARKFNNHFGKTFIEPETFHTQSPKIIGLDGQAKMSKSKDNALFLTDTPEMIQTRLKTAFTDPSRLRLKDPGHPEICNIWTLHHLVQKKERVEKIAEDCRAATLGCAQCKQDLGKMLAEYLEPIRSSYNQWKKKTKDVIEIFHEGGKSAGKIARTTMEEVRDKMGLRCLSP